MYTFLKAFTVMAPVELIWFLKLAMWFRMIQLSCMLPTAGAVLPVPMLKEGPHDYPVVAVNSFLYKEEQM